MMTRIVKSLLDLLQWPDEGFSGRRACRDSCTFAFSETMAHFASRRLNYSGQLGMLFVFVGAGLVLGTLLSVLPVLSKLNVFNNKEASTSELIQALMVPANANMVRLMQFFSTLGLFFLPALLYARYCHGKIWKHLGMNRLPDPRDLLLMLLLMIAVGPLVAALQELFSLIPWSQSARAMFKSAEDGYFKQVAVIARMDSTLDLILSLLVVALLPAVFEEMLFRGALQNLLIRWFKHPLAAILLTSVVFSAVHGSYLGFLSRVALGAVLGFMYYRTGNLWVSILAHAFNNGMAVMAIYLAKQPGKPLDFSKLDEHYPLWAGAISLIVAVALGILFNRKASSNGTPGEEIALPDERNPFAHDHPEQTAG